MSPLEHDTSPASDCMVEAWGLLAALVMAVICACAFGVAGVLTSWALHANQTTLTGAITTVLQLLGILANGGRPL